MASVYNAQSTFASLLDWCLALLPILVVLVLMVGFRWGGARAGAAGWLAALALAALRFGAGWRVLAYAQWKGVLLTLYVLYIMWGALLFYRVTEDAGAVAAIGAGLPRQPALYVVGALVVVLGAALTVAVIYLVYRHASALLARLGEVGTLVMTRLMAFVLLCIGIDILWAGWAELNGIANR